MRALWVVWRAAGLASLCTRGEARAEIANRRDREQAEIAFVAARLQDGEGAQMEADPGRLDRLDARQDRLRQPLRSQQRIDENCGIVLKISWLITSNSVL